MEIQKQTVVCPKCSHQWDTKAKGIWITCPNCMRKSIKEAMRIIVPSLGEKEDK